MDGPAEPEETEGTDGGDEVEGIGAEGGYEWAVDEASGALVLQFPPLAVVRRSGPADAVRALFTARGFVPVDAPGPGNGSGSGPGTGSDTGLDLGSLPVARQCALALVDDTHADLVVRVGPDAASRVPVPHGDVAWSTRVARAGEVVVLVTEAAVREGQVTAARLRRDAEAGAVVGARLPAGPL